MKTENSYTDHILFQIRERYYAFSTRFPQLRHYRILHGFCRLMYSVLVRIVFLVVSLFYLLCYVAFVRHTAMLSETLKLHGSDLRDCINHSQKLFTINR